MLKMPGGENEIFNEAVRLLARRDYSIAGLRQKLGELPEGVLERLVAKRYLDDRRYAETYISRHRNRGPERLQAELVQHGVDPSLAAEIVARSELDSLQQVLAAKMIAW